MKSSVRKSRVLALPRVALRSRIIRAGVSVPSGTPASKFVALTVPRVSFCPRKFQSVSRSVALRLVASEYPNSPRYTLSRVLAKIRQTVRSETFKRISERLASRIGKRGADDWPRIGIDHRSSSDGSGPSRFQ